MRALGSACAALLVAACGSFTPVDEPGEGSVSGCLVRADGSAARAVPVFALRDQAVVVEGRTGDDGCFALRGVPSGRVTLVANDFRGEGLLEVLRLYASQSLALSPRTLYALTLDPTLPTLRGVGAGEALGDASSVECDEDRAEARVLGLDATTHVDAQTGARELIPSAVLTTTSPPPPRYFYNPGAITQLRWRDTGQSVPLPEGLDCWSDLRANPDAFAASVGVRGPTGFCSARQRVHGFRAGHVVTLEGPLGPAEPCTLMGERCVRVEVADRNARARIATAQGEQPVQLITFEPEEVAVTQVLNEAAGTVTFITNSPSGARVWQARFAQSGSGRVLGTFAGRMAQGVSGAPGPEAGNGRFVIALLDGGAEGSSWLRVGLVDGSVSVQPFELPSLTDPSGVAFRVGGAAAPAAVGLARLPSLAWGVEVLEHLGTTLRRRTTTLAPSAEPNFALSSQDQNPLAAFFPGFEWVPMPAAGLEVFATRSRLFVLAAGAPFSSAREVATLGVASRPVCAVGNSLVVQGYAPDLNGQLLRYDMRRIADELAAAP